MDKDKVLDLARLARIEIGEDEAEKLSREFDAILRYVGEVKSISTTDNSQPTAEALPVRNVMREDGEPHQSGMYTQELLDLAPQREGDYVKVKKIL